MKKISFNDYIPEELADTESCRLITEEQYQEYQLLKKKLAIAIEALKEIEKNVYKKDVKTITTLVINDWLWAHKALKEMEGLK